MCIRDRQIEKQEAERIERECMKGSQLYLELDGKTYDVLIKEMDYRPMDHQILEMDFQALVTVSYTHLDVYKRQVINTVATCTGTPNFSRNPATPVEKMANGVPSGAEPFTATAPTTTRATIPRRDSTTMAP